MFFVVLSHGFTNNLLPEIDFFFVTSIFESRKKDERNLITSYVVKRFHFFLLIFNSSGFVHCTIEILVCLILSLGSDIHFLHYLVSVFLILKLRGRL